MFELFLLNDFINEKFLNIWSVLSRNKDTFGVEIYWLDIVSFTVYCKSVCYFDLLRFYLSA